MMSGNGMYARGGMVPASNYGMPGMSPSNAGMAGGFGALGAGLGQLFFGGGDSPYDAASPYINQISNKTSPYYKPYAEAGGNALNQLSGQYGSLINDPNAKLNQIGAGYQKSPGYDWQMNQGMQAANNAAAAGGMIGSPQHQQNAQTTAQGIANQDYYNYVNHALGLYGTGLQGMSGINQMGYGANDQMARIMADQLSQQGQMAFAGQAAQNQNEGQMWGNIAGGAAQLLPFLL